MYAAGSFGGSVSLYSEDESGTVGHLEGVEGGGVTQVSRALRDNGQDPKYRCELTYSSSAFILYPQITSS